MFNAEKVSEFQAKVQQAFESAQAKAAARMRDFETEARKALETLGDRAQAELKILFARAKTDTREQVVQLGGELIKLGKKLQEMARAEAAPASDGEKAEAAGGGTQPPAN
jgi:hypothetical protein